MHNMSTAVATFPLESVACTCEATGCIFAAFSVFKTVIAHGSTRLPSFPVLMYLSIAASIACDVDELVL